MKHIGDDMHVPDAFLDVPTSVATGVVAAAALGVALRSTRIAPPGRESRSAPSRSTTAVVTAFIFAGQMVNVPIADGTSGHLMGGVLATVLLGPARALIAMSLVLSVQAVLFADGGLTALGTNIVLMGLIPVLTAWALLGLAKPFIQKGPWARLAVGVAAGFVSVPLSATVFVGLYAMGGLTPVAVTSLASGMISWHLLIGLIEAVVTGVVLGAVMVSRPRVTQRALMIGGAAAAVLTATVVSQWASGHPDGLEFVAETLGFLGTASDSAAAVSPLADYATAGISSTWASLAVAGAAGTAATFALSLLQASRHTASDSEEVRHELHAR